MKSLEVRHLTPRCFKGIAHPPPKLCHPILELFNLFFCILLTLLVSRSNLGPEVTCLTWTCREKDWLGLRSFFWGHPGLAESRVPLLGFSVAIRHLQCLG